MQSTSQAWKDNQLKNVVSEAFVEVNLTVGDPDAQLDAATTVNGEEEFSHAAEISEETEKEPVKYLTGEKHIWILDGTMTTVPETGWGEQGYIGTALSGADGSFAEGAIPTITVSFSKVFENTVPGVTVVWSEVYGEWADTVRITAWNGTTQVAQATVEGNTDITTVLALDMAGYDKITIEILKWCLPYRRARVKSLLLGVERTYAKGDLMGYDHSMFVDPLSASAPKSEITFQVSNLDGEYNPDNPEGFAKYMMERQELTARYGFRVNGSTEWIKAGTFYLSEWDTPQNGITATFTARDMLEFMGDAYTGPSTGTLYAIAEAALKQANLPTRADGSVRWSLDDSLKSVTAPAGADLSETSLMAVIQYCANAGCCVFYQDREGTLRVEPLGTGETDYEINRFNSYQNSELSLTKQLRAVNINNGQYVLTVGQVGETQPVNNPLISDAQAPVVAAWVAGYLQNRRTLSGEFRADPRLDPLDRIKNTNQFSESVVLVTEFKLTFNGAFRGSYEGRAGV